MSSPPEQPPEGKLLEDLRKVRGMSARMASKAAGLSDTWWREVVMGYRKVGDGQYAVQRASPSALARMAQVVGATADQLRQAARGDAADYLEQMSSGGNAEGEAGRSLDTAGLADEDFPVVQAVIDAIRSKTAAVATEITPTAT